MDTTPSEWLGVIEQEYLQDFIREGGAAVKFVLPYSDASRLQIRAGLADAAERNGFQFAIVDAAATKIHLIDQLFHQVARQIDWDGLAESYLRSLLTHSGYSLPPCPGTLTLSSLAESNGRPESVLRGHIDQLIIDNLFRDYGMTQEFRLAMMYLCEGYLAMESPDLVGAIHEWLTGELRLVSALKRALIFQKIARHNARHMLISLVHWLKVAGKSGLLLMLDISRYTDVRRPADREAGLYYSNATTLDVYEVLRQLIDGTDELEYGFICVMADPLFLIHERRGLLPSAGNAYQALYMRITDEVRDPNRQNPLAALVRLGDAS